MGVSSYVHTLAQTHGPVLTVAGTHTHTDAIKTVWQESDQRYVAVMRLCRQQCWKETACWSTTTKCIRAKSQIVSIVAICAFSYFFHPFFLLSPPHCTILFLHVFPSEVFFFSNSEKVNHPFISFIWMLIIQGPTRSKFLFKMQLVILLTNSKGQEQVLLLFSSCLGV